MNKNTTNPRKQQNPNKNPKHKNPNREIWGRGNQGKEQEKRGKTIRDAAAGGGPSRFWKTEEEKRREALQAMIREAGSTSLDSHPFPRVSAAWPRAGRTAEGGRSYGVAGARRKGRFGNFPPIPPPPSYASMGRSGRISNTKRAWMKRGRGTGGVKKRRIRLWVRKESRYRVVGGEARRNGGKEDRTRRTAYDGAAVCIRDTAVYVFLGTWAVDLSRVGYAKFWTRSLYPEHFALSHWPILRTKVKGWYLLALATGAHKRGHFHVAPRLLGRSS